MSNILSPHIILNGEIYTEILDKDIPNVKPGQYINKDGIIYAPNFRYKIRNPIYGSNRYARIRIYMNDGSVYLASLHRILMIVFNPVFNMNELVVNHKDGKKYNNSLMHNLEWTTETENVHHAIRSGLTPIGENHHCAKLTNQQVEEICKELEKPKEYGSISNLAKKYNVSDTIIRSIAHGYSWTQISSKYNIDYNDKGISNILTEEQVREICQNLADYHYHGQYSELARKYNVAQSTIKQIVYRQSWTTISKDYNF